MKPAIVKTPIAILPPNVIEMIDDHADYIEGLLKYHGVDDIPSHIESYRYYAEQGYRDYYMGEYNPPDDWSDNETYKHFIKHAMELDTAL